MKFLPVLLIADYNIPGYITTDDLRSVNELSPNTNIMIVSSDDDKKNIMRMLASKL